MEAFTWHNLGRDHLWPSGSKVHCTVWWRVLAHCCLPCTLPSRLHYISQLTAGLLCTRQKHEQCNTSDITFLSVTRAGTAHKEKPHSQTVFRLESFDIKTTKSVAQGIWKNLRCMGRKIQDSFVVQCLHPKGKQTVVRHQSLPLVPDLIKSFTNSTA